jgi:hypothetical protein
MPRAKRDLYDELLLILRAHAVLSLELERVLAILGLLTGPTDG